MGKEEGILNMSSWDQLEPGDVILFRTPARMRTTQKLISFTQAIIDRKHGHFETTHAAICVSKNPTEIAHLTGGKVMGYKREPLKDMMDRDGGDRLFVAYRHNDETTRRKIAEEAGNEDKHKDIKWVFKETIPALFKKTDKPAKPTKKDYDQYQFAQNSFCSKFVAQVVKKVMKGKVSSQEGKGFSTSISPKALEAGLYTNNNFTSIVYPGKGNPYDCIKKAIKNECERLAKRGGATSQTKAQNILQQLAKFHIASENKNLDGFNKAVKLLQSMKTALSEQRGLFGFGRKTTSYKNALKAAREVGIYERDIKSSPKSH